MADNGFNLPITLFQEKQSRFCHNELISQSLPVNRKINVMHTIPNGKKYKRVILNFINNCTTLTETQSL